MLNYENSAHERVAFFVFQAFFLIFLASKCLQSSHLSGQRGDVADTAQRDDYVDRLDRGIHVHPLRGILLLIPGSGSGSEFPVTVSPLQCPLSDMFGYTSQLRSLTEGKAEFSMEYSRWGSVVELPSNIDLSTAHFEANLSKKKNRGKHIILRIQECLRDFFTPFWLFWFFKAIYSNSSYPNVIPSVLQCVANINPIASFRFVTVS